MEGLLAAAAVAYALSKPRKEPVKNHTDIYVEEFATEPVDLRYTSPTQDKFAGYRLPGPDFTNARDATDMAILYQAFLSGDRIGSVPAAALSRDTGEPIVLTGNGLVRVPLNWNF